MLYMVLERFKPGVAPAVHRRRREEGRHLVDGLGGLLRRVRWMA